MKKTASLLILAAGLFAAGTYAAPPAGFEPQVPVSLPLPGALMLLSRP